MIEAVYGVSSVVAALAAQRRTLHKLLLMDTSFRSGERVTPVLRRLRAEAETLGLPIAFASKRILAELSGAFF
jgi:hypothetical protein